MNRPFIHVSFAQSLDGRIATLTGDARYVSSPESLKFTHRLRSQLDAILVGIGTVLQDNPMLSARIEGETPKQPTRIVLDSKLQIPLDSKIVQSAKIQKTIIYYGQAEKDKLAVLQDHGCLCEQLEPNANQQIDLHQLLSSLQKKQIKSVFVEGGAKILTSFFKEDLVDQLSIVISPMIIGKGIEAINDLDIRILANAKKFQTKAQENLGPDLVWHLIPDQKADYQ